MKKLIFYAILASFIGSHEVAHCLQVSQDSVQAMSIFDSKREIKLGVAAVIGGGIGALAAENPQRAEFQRILDKTSPVELQRTNQSFTEKVINERVRAQRKLEMLPTRFRHRVGGAIKGAIFLGLPTLAVLLAPPGDTQLQRDNNEAKYAIGGGVGTGAGLYLVNKFIFRQPSTIVLPIAGVMVGMIAWHIAKGIPYNYGGRTNYLIR